MFQSTPTHTRFRVEDIEKVKKIKTLLTYTDTSVDFVLGKHRKSIKSMINNPDFWKEKLGSRYASRLAWLNAEVKKLQASRERCLLGVVDEEGGVYECPRGLLGKVLDVGVDHTYPNSWDPPVPKAIPWNKIPFPMREYQQAAFYALAEAEFGSISLSTGAGKTRILAQLIKHYGLKTLVMVPSTSIATQMFDDFENWFGRGKVGLFGGGKKKSDKLITIGIDDSLVKVVPGNEHWDNLRACQLFLVDEAHILPSETQEIVATGVAGNAVYRFAVSATLFRNDGRDLLLEGFAGPVVYRKELMELVDEGYLARPNVYVHKLDSGVVGLADDPNEQTRDHLFYSEAVNRLAVKLVEEGVDNKQPVLVAIDEVEQFSHLIRHLSTSLRVGFAHGPLNKDNRDSVPEPYRSQDPKEQVALFNAGKLDVLIGTSCVAMGTDTRIPERGIYLVGGKSLIELSQRMGRCTRGGYKSTVENPYTGATKASFEWHDIWVTNSPVCSFHAKERIKYYEELGGVTFQ